MMGGDRASNTRTDTAPTSFRAASTATIGGCVNPIRLRGYYQRIDAATGELLTQLGSSESGGGALVVSCKDRRASCCPSCARLYERDAYHLLAAGLRGGKSIPASVGAHPAVLLTLTAPSFGSVHGNRDHDRPCRCGRQHHPEDPLNGTATDAGSYRYAEQIVWNHYAPQLWKRTVQGVRRHLARALGVPRAKLSASARIRFAKVTEFQRRGVVHYHAIIRIDGPDGINSLPPSRCTTKLLVQVVQAAAGAAKVTLSEIVLNELPTGAPAVLRWGTQREVDALDPQTCTAAAGYIAKYATKATETATGGTLIKPIRSATALARLPLRDHPRTLIATAWEIGERTGDHGFKRWAHQFGYGGHTLTKSHKYSVTFAALRAARSSWHAATTEADVIVRAHLTHASRSHLQPKRPR